MRARALLTGLAVALVLALGGCGSDDGTDATTGASTATGTSTTTGATTATGASTATGATPTTPAADGEGQSIAGTGYRTVVPAGWRDAAELAEGTAFRVDRLYASPEGGTTRANVVIIREDPQGLAGRRIEDLEAQLRAQSARAVGAPTPPAEEPTALDGETAVRWTIRRRQGADRLVQRQLSALHEDALYTVTLTTTAGDGDRGEEQLRALIAGWRWR